MGVKVLNNLINKDDAIGIIESIDDKICPTNPDNQTTKAYLQMARNCIERLTEINIVEAGDINIVCGDSKDLEKYLSKYKNSN